MTPRSNEIPRPEIQLRPYQERDWLAICRVHDLARPDELRGSCDPRAFTPIEADPEVEDLKRSQKIVSEVAGRVVGFVGVDGDELAWLYVDPAFYGRGVGRRLLRRALEMIDGTAWTIVLAGNQRALRLYESEGFQVARRFESDNAGYPCTCLRMERNDQENKGP
jgi:ribosomal protein S18 acetylase RimI-like enzyme